MRRCRVLLGLLVLAADAAAVDAVTRGPYLQMASPTAVTIRWRTNLAHIGRVRYGTSPASLTSSLAEASASTDHEVRLTGLTANRRYYYSVGTAAATIAGDASYTFLSPPAVGTRKPTRIWVIGDAGTRDANQRAVRDAYATFTGARRTDLWLMLGDNAYDDGTDAEYQLAVFDVYGAMLRSSVLWPAIGNHDAHLNPPSYLSIFTLPTQAQAGGVASGSEHYYSFDHANVHFVCLDSQITSRAANGAMATWLREDLAATAQRWLIAYWHHPPYSKGSHDSDSEARLVEMRQNFLPILEDHGVDLVLSGHSHSYERSYLIDSHYGLAASFTAAHKVDAGTGGGATPYTKGAGPHEGAVYAVAGSSGKVSGGALDHPAMVVSLNQLGSLVLDVDGDRLDARFIRETGAVADAFSLLKSSGSLDLVVAASADDAEEAAGGAVSLASPDLELTDANGVAQTVGVRWTGLAIPRGATVTRAYAQFACDETGAAAASLAIRGHAADSAAAFTATAGSISTRPRTTAAVAWSPAAWNAVGEAGPAQRTPDLAGVVQEVIDRPGWASGNALALIVTGSGRRTADSADDVAAVPPLLHVEWTVPGTTTSIAVRTASSADDAEEDAGGVVSLASSDLDMTRGGTSTQTVGLRFPAVAIPQGSLITSATIQFTCDETGSAATSLAIRGLAADSAGPFTATAAGISGRARTAAAVAWSPLAWPTLNAAGAEQRTAELKAIVQEIVDRAGWASGNAIGFVITGSGHRCADAFEGGAGVAPLLQVTFVAPPGGGG